MTESWYQIVAAEQPLSQGGVILDCPVLVWKRENPTISSATPAPLVDRAALLQEDVVVMTQACDLEHHKIHEVVPCRHIAITAYRKNDWEPWMTARGQAPSDKSWRRFCEDKWAAPPGDVDNEKNGPLSLNLRRFNKGG